VGFSTYRGWEGAEAWGWLPQLMTFLDEGDVMFVSGTVRPCPQLDNSGYSSDPIQDVAIALRKCPSFGLSRTDPNSTLHYSANTGTAAVNANTGHSSGCTNCVTAAGSHAGGGITGPWGAFGMDAFGRKFADFGNGTSKVIVVMETSRSGTGADILYSTSGQGPAPPWYH
jgi:hypothetical protein